MTGSHKGETSHMGGRHNASNEGIEPLKQNPQSIPIDSGLGHIFSFQNHLDRG